MCVKQYPSICGLLILPDELGNWRPERNKFSRAYFKAYHDRFPIAAPKDDYEDRNALYAM